MRGLTCLFLSVFVGLGSISAAQPSWSVVSHNFEFSMTITGKVAIDGQISMDEGDKIAVFVGEECRGVTNVRYDPGLNGYFIYLMVYGNKMGEILTFSVYDASRDKILVVKNTLSFNVNNIVGSPDEPYLFNANSLTPSADISNPEINVYPNPFTDQLNIDFSGKPGKTELLLYSVNWHLVAKYTVDPNEGSTLDTRGLSAGVYFLVWICDNKREYIKLIRN